MLEPIVGTIGEREPNNSGTSATRVEYNQEFVGSSAYSEGNGTDVDYFYVDGHAGDTIQMTGEITLALPGTQYGRCGTEFWLQFNGESGAPLGRVASGAFSSFFGPTDPLILTFPADGRYYTAVGAQSRETLQYRARVQRLTPSPTSVAWDHRDVVLVSSSDGGVTWSGKRLVNDDPPRFDNYMPEVEVDGLGRVHVAWYDRRDAPDPGFNYHVYWTCSTDGGRTFAPSVPLSATQSVIPGTQRMELGDRMDLAGTDEGVVGAWTFAKPLLTDDDTDDQDIHARRVDVPTLAAAVDLVATGTLDRASLAWQTVEPWVLHRFRVERRVAGSGAEFDSVGAVDRASDPETLGYTFSDSIAEASGRYEYRVAMILANGWVRNSEPVLVSVPGIPTRLGLRLLSASTPSDRVTRIELTAPQPGEVELRVFDVNGSPIRTLTGIAVQLGLNTLSWDGLDSANRRPASGVYFIEARLADHRASLKLVMTGR